MSVMIRLNSSQGKRERVGRDIGLFGRMLKSTGNSSIQFLTLAFLALVSPKSRSQNAPVSPVEKQMVKQPSREESLRYVGDGYEQLMLQMLFEQMKKSQEILADGEENPFAPSNAEKIFQGMKDQQMIEAVAQHRPLGVSDLVVRSLKGDSGVSRRNLVK